MGITHSDPFGRVPTNSKLVSVLVTSFHISCLYLAFTGIAVLLLSQATENRSIRFLASNTLWVFLCHMPLRDWLTPYYYPLVTGWHRQLSTFCSSSLLWHSLRNWFDGYFESTGRSSGLQEEENGSWNNWMAGDPYVKGQQWIATEAAAG